MRDNVSFGDQDNWSAIGQRKGTAIAPVPQKKLTDQLFINNVKDFVANKPLYENAKGLSKKLQGEDGVHNAVQKIESF
jgi:hypothetical protein